MPFVTDEVVTAAKLNMATFISGDDNIGETRTFTNTSFADLDALTGGAGTMGALVVSATTGTSALVMMTVRLLNATVGASTFMGFRISGATTLAASDSTGCRWVAPTAVGLGSLTFQMRVNGLTAGTNVFECQARVTAGTGEIQHPTLVVMGVV